LNDLTQGALMKRNGFFCGLILLMVSGSVLFACSKDDGGGSKAPPASKKQTNAAAKSLNAVQGFGNLSTGAGNGVVEGHLARAYQMFKSDYQRVVDDSANSSFTEVICAAFNTCGSDGQIETDSKGVQMACDISCRGDKVKPLYSCVMEDDLEMKCDSGVTYSVAKGGRVQSGMACEKAGESTYRLSINGAYNFVVSSSDGALKDTDFKCSWMASVDMNGDKSLRESLGSKPADLIQDCSAFSCTIDGAAVNCDELKAALKKQDNACNASTTED
jgi:hypothetical protein